MAAVIDTVIATGKVGGCGLVSIGAAETPFWFHFKLKQPNVCQDRLGIKTGNVEHKTRFCLI
jgi:hypothetical protein